MHARNTHQLAPLSVELPSQQHTIHVVRKTVPAEHPLGVVRANNMPDSPTAAEQDSLLVRPPRAVGLSAAAPCCESYQYPVCIQHSCMHGSAPSRGLWSCSAQAYMT